MTFDANTYLPTALNRTAASINRDFAKFLKVKCALSLAQWQILSCLSKTKTASVRDIHQELDIDKPKISRAAAQLVKTGHAKKIQNSADKRLVALSLTPKGMALWDEMTPHLQNYERAMLEKLGPTNKKLLLSLLANLSERDT